MQKVSKIFQYLSATSGAIWLGAELSRIMLTFYLFQGNHFELKPFISDGFLQAIFYIQNPLLVVTSVAYSLFFVSLILFTLTTALKLRANGWLFIIVILTLTLAPFEFYLIYLDYKILTEVFYNTFVPKSILGMVITRFKVLGSFPLIHLFAFMAMIYLSIFQPFKKNEN